MEVATVRDYFTWIKKHSSRKGLNKVEAICFACNTAQKVAGLDHQ